MAGKGRSDRQGLERGLQGVLFLGLFIYLWKGIETPLLYHGFGVFTAYPVFSFEGSFFRITLDTPGGGLGALAALLAQSYSNAWLGALVIAGLLGVLFLGVQRLLRSMHAEKLRDLAWVPPILALVIYNHYDNPLPVLLAIGVALWTAILYGSLEARTLWRRAGLFGVFFAVVYILIGASAFVFVGIVCLVEALYRRRGVEAILQGVLASGLGLVLGRFVFDLDLRAICTAGTPWDPTRGQEFSTLSSWLALVLHAFLPGLLLGVSLGGFLMRVGLGMWRSRRGQGAPPATDPRPAGRPRAHDPRVGIGLRMLMVSVTAVLCLAFSWTYIHDERALHCYAQHREWDRVLALAQRMRGRHSFTRSGVFDINRALAHQGRLGSELCAYPQDDIQSLFLSYKDMTGRLQHAKALELYLDLGYLNAAEKNAYELLENEGPSPYVLEALVRVHLAKGQTEAAQVVFKALQKYVGCREYARRWQDIIGDPAGARGLPLIQAWQRVARTSDSAVEGIAFEPTLKRLLQDTPDHRLAFEYFMAYYLLKHQRAQLVGLLPLLKSMGYRQLPRHYAEALLVHSMETRTRLDAQGWTLEPDLIKEARDIADIVRDAKGDHQAAFDRLAPKYGDTYTFYSIFNVCGLK